MLKSYVILITEVDDAADALAELSAQMPRVALLKNSVGIVDCHVDFLSSGVFEAVCKTLPFETIGGTSASVNANGVYGSFYLSVLILTSDTCSFETALSEPLLGQNARAVTQNAYSKALGALGGAPKAAFLYMPLVEGPLMRDYLAAIAEVDPFTPVFGKLVNDAEGPTPLAVPKTLHNGAFYADRFAVLLVAGDVTPKFYIAALTKESVVMSRVGEITECDGNKLTKINDAPAPGFLRDIGFFTGENDADGLPSTTFILETPEGEVSRAAFSITDDAIYFSAGLTCGAALSIALSSPEAILAGAKALIEQINAENEKGPVIIYSCIARRFGLGGEPHKELEIIAENIGGGFSYIAGCANGEVCPVAAPSGKTRNEEHNHTLIACVL